MIYAGIGCRQTPPDILDIMHQIAQNLAAENWTLRSGRAAGADTAFEKGALSILPAGPRPELYPVGCPTPLWAHMMAQKYHPAWERCTHFAKLAHARNSLIVCGRSEPRQLVSHIICWTPGGQISGGTGQALRIAQDLRIPVLNLAIPTHIPRALSLHTHQEA